jgi:hypothetical protein
MKSLHAFMLAAALAGPSALMAGDYKFSAPRQVSGGDKLIEVESPGYAAPGLADLNADGVPDLLVGQFRDGKIGFYKGSKSKDGMLSFGAHEWLQAAGETAVVPGVW